MSPFANWSLIAAALAAGWLSYRWQGIALALTVIVFWMLLQLSRALRVMRRAAAAPVGHIASAVMLQARLRPGLTMEQLLTLTGSLGERVTPPDGTEESWRWRDAGDASLTVHFSAGRSRAWELQRPDAAQ